MPQRFPPIQHAVRRLARLAAVLPAALLLAAVTGGCEERIVGVRNGYTSSNAINRTSSSSGTPVFAPPPAPRPQPTGFFDQVGEVLFGWTRIFDEPPPNDPLRGGAYKITDPKERMSRPQVKSSE